MAIVHYEGLRQRPKKRGAWRQPSRAKRPYAPQHAHGIASSRPHCSGRKSCQLAGPTAKFQYVINLKTAESLDLTVTLTMQMTADEVSNHVALRPICMDRPRVASPK